MGIGEWLLILVIVVVLFGANRLPALGEGLGKAIRNFKGAARPDEPPAAPKGELPPRDDGAAR